MPNHASSAPADGTRAVWRTRDVAAFWQRTPTTVMRWVADGEHPPPRRDPGGRRYWLAEEVEAFARRGGDTAFTVSPVTESSDPDEIPPLELVIGDGNGS